MVVANNTTTTESENSSVVEETQQKAVKVAEKTKPSETQNTEELLQNQPESDTIQEKPLEKGAKNGVDEGRSLSEKYEQRSELQKTGKQVEKIQDTVSGRSDFELSWTSVYKRGFDDTSRRIKQTEARKLEELLNKYKKKYTYQVTPQEYNEYINIYLSKVEKARKNIDGNSIENYAKAKEKAKERMSNYKKNRLITRYKSKVTKVN